MIQYKYLVGDKISFVNQDRTRTAPSGNYRIIARRPVSDGEPQYVIKSDLERYDRVAAESDLK